MRADTLFSCFSLSLSETGSLQQQCMREGNGFHLTAIFSFLLMIVMTSCSMWFSITLVEGDWLQHPTTLYSKKWLGEWMEEGCRCDNHRWMFSSG